MNLKYYLRGLGIGVIVTAVIMGIALGGRKEELSDEQIRARALELGMIEENIVLKDLGKAPEATPAKTPEKEAEATPVKTPEKEAEATPAKTPEKEAEATPVKTPEKAPEATPMKTPENVRGEDITSAEEKIASVDKEVTIEIKSGEGSYDVCEKLENKKVIDSARAFDLFLCSKGYDKKISAGIHIIPAGSSEEDIAKILTNK